MDKYGRQGKFASDNNGQGIQNDREDCCLGIIEWSESCWNSSSWSYTPGQCFNQGPHCNCTQYHSSIITGWSGWGEGPMFEDGQWNWGSPQYEMVWQCMCSPEPGYLGNQLSSCGCTGGPGRVGGSRSMGGTGPPAWGRKGGKISPDPRRRR